MKRYLSHEKIVLPSSTSKNFIMYLYCIRDFPCSVILDFFFRFSMLRHKFFHRAKKVAVPEELLKAKKKRDPSKSNDEKEKKEKKEDDVAESSHAEGKGQEVTIYLFFFLQHTINFSLKNQNDDLCKRKRDEVMKGNVMSDWTTYLHQFLCKSCLETPENLVDHYVN